MRLHQLTLQCFRNIEFARLELAENHVFFLGANGMGKTNVLEAISLMTALRSFRTTKRKAMIQQGCEESGTFYTLEHERHHQTELLIRHRSGKQEVYLDDRKVNTLGEVLCDFPTVVLCAEDSHLVRGSPGARRKFMDLTLSTNPAYLSHLMHYHRALRQRNAALREPATGRNIYEAFEREMANHAVELVAHRVAALQTIAAETGRVYGTISNHQEAISVHYAPNISPFEYAEEWIAHWANHRETDRQKGHTANGPHRDDFQLLCKELPAREYASEGQQRTLVLALKRAQAHYMHQQTGVKPLILADDILGQLDAERQKHFWQFLGQDNQVFATGTSMPANDASNTWKIYHVEHGHFTANA